MHFKPHRELHFCYTYHSHHFFFTHPVQGYATLSNAMQDYTTLYKAIRDYTTLYSVIQDYTTLYTKVYNTYDTTQ